MTLEPARLFPEETAASSRGRGILPCQVIGRLIEEGRIHSSVSIADEQIQPASIDLRLGPVAYRVRASFLPGAGLVEAKIRELQIAEVDLRRPAVFERGAVYIVPLLEQLDMPDDVSAKANPKSTTGRLDIFTRLMTDGGFEFERIVPGYRGRLYAEIVSRTFPVSLCAGMKLNQLRFIRGKERASDTALRRLHRNQILVYEGEGGEESAAKAVIDEGLKISLDLQGSSADEVVAYKARKNSPVVYLDRVGCHDPEEFWEPIANRSGKGIILDPGDFYLLASKEKIRVPPTTAAEMVPFDPSMGEFRIHYAGFFDPGFGYGTSDIRGTKAVLEVRAHDVPILLEHEQIVGRLIYSDLAEPPDKVYGPAIGSSYQQQGLALSKQFKRFNT
jgi:dCTP deaminase